MKNELKLRGAVALLHRAISYIGRNQPTREFGDGGYCNPAIEEADHILRKALWETERDFDKVSK